MYKDKKKKKNKIKTRGGGFSVTPKPIPVTFFEINEQTGKFSSEEDFQSADEEVTATPAGGQTFSAQSASTPDEEKQTEDLAREEEKLEISDEAEEAPFVFDRSKVDFEPDEEFLSTYVPSEQEDAEEETEEETEEEEKTFEKWKEAVDFEPDTDDNDEPEKVAKDEEPIKEEPEPEGEIEDEEIEDEIAEEPEPEAAYEIELPKNPKTKKSPTRNPRTKRTRKSLQTRNPNPSTKRTTKSLQTKKRLSKKSKR